MNNIISVFTPFNKQYKRWWGGFAAILQIGLLMVTLAPVPHEWNKEDLAMLSWLSLTSDKIAAVKPSAEVELGRQLFMDKGLSASGKVSCSSCHNPEFHYGDPDNMTRTLNPDAPHRAPRLRGVSTQSWFFWDGRADSLWSQALASLENPSEHFTTRLEVAQRLCDVYYQQYPSLLGPCSARNVLPAQTMAASPTHPAIEVQQAWQKLTVPQQQLANELFVLTGKLIAAFETTLIPEPSRFDAYVHALQNGRSEDSISAMTPQEIAGLRLFIDKETGCIDCHNGPLFSNSGFYVVGTDNPGTTELDRQQGIKTLLDSEFNCLAWDAAKECPHTRYLKTNGAELVGAYKVPSLRNLNASFSFMHDGRYTNLDEVIEHYSKPNILPLRHMDIRPLRLFKYQKDQLMAFLLALNDPCKECYEK